jgi:hypothetical protein
VRQCMAVRVYGSVCQCARQCAVAWQCGSGSVWQCAAVRQCGSVQQCGSAAVWQCAAVQCDGSVMAVRAAVCGSALYVYIHTKSLTVLVVYFGMP